MSAEYLVDNRDIPKYGRTLLKAEPWLGFPKFLIGTSFKNGGVSHALELGLQRLTDGDEMIAIEGNGDLIDSKVLEFLIARARVRGKVVRNLNISSNPAQAWRDGKFDEAELATLKGLISLFREGASFFYTEPGHPIIRSTCPHRFEVNDPMRGIERVDKVCFADLHDQPPIDLDEAMHSAHEALDNWGRILRPDTPVWANTTRGITNWKQLYEAVRGPHPQFSLSPFSSGFISKNFE